MNTIQRRQAAVIINALIQKPTIAKAFLEVHPELDIAQGIFSFFIENWDSEKGTPESISQWAGTLPNLAKQYEESKQFAVTEISDINEIIHIIEIALTRIYSSSLEV